MSRTKRTTIEINGRLYDAVTGQLLENSGQQDQTRRTKRSAPAPSGGSIDGFIPQSNRQKSTNSTNKAQAPSKPAKRAPNTATKMHHRTKKSRTLNRSVVTPPPTKPATTTAGAAPTPQQQNSHSLAAQVHAARKARAAGVSKSPSVTRFSAPAKAEVTPPEPEPEQTPTTPPTMTSTPPSAPAIASNKQALISQQLNTALEQPQIPEEKLPLGQRISTWVGKKRTASLVASSLAAVLLIGYVTYLNIPRIALRVAAGRAGFEAEMPSYSPSGFSFSGPVAYSPGQITIQFTSNTDDRQYRIIERETTWDSQTLLDNHVLEKTELYSTYQERGLTVYVYDGSTATWVNGGIWYTVEGDSELTAEQLLKIAVSL